MKKRNPWKIACLILTSGILAVSTVTFTGWKLVKADGTQAETIVPSEQCLNPTTVDVDQQAAPPLDVPQDQTLPEDMKNVKDDNVPPPLVEPQVKPSEAAKRADKTAKLVVHVMDGRTGKPLPGAEVVLVETAQRFKTDATGSTAAIDAPIIREDRYPEVVAQLHGQLGLIAYKNGYRDAISIGVRMHEGTQTNVTMWMYEIGPGDRRIEPVFYSEPYHHLYLVRLAEEFRSPSQPGEGRESPDR